MVRVGMLLYLMLATAAGPWLCCCMPDRLTAHRPSSRGEVADGGRKKTGLPRCCNHPRKDNKAPKNLPASPTSCPCGETRYGPVVLTAPARDVAGQHVRLPNSLESIASFLPVPDADCLCQDTHGGSPKVSVAFRFHDGRDILRALHILRC